MLCCYIHASTQCFSVDIGEGQAELSFTGKLAIANILPEYGPTMGLFPMDYGICNVSN